MGKKRQELHVDGVEVRLLTIEEDDYISLTDMARSSNERTDLVLQTWMRNRNTIEFLGLWEEIHNPDFNPYEFAGIKSQTGLNNFYISAKEWIERTHARGLVSRTGRYGGTFAHKDIAFEFGTWLSPRFKMFLIKDYQRLKEEEANTQSLEWNVKRLLSKANYRIHTEAVREFLVPPLWANTKREGVVFASEADLLNTALFGMTAREWKLNNPEAKGNMRDYATAEQLIVLANLEALNAKLLEWGCDQDQRIEILNKTAIDQINILLGLPSVKALEQGRAKDALPE
jgi:hypothetical protein